jgi:hypothetical protein
MEEGFSRSKANCVLRVTALAVTVSSTVATQTVTSTTSTTTETVNSVTTTTIIEPSMSTGEQKNLGCLQVSRRIVSIDLKPIVVAFGLTPESSYNSWQYLPNLGAVRLLH